MAKNKSRPLVIILVAMLLGGFVQAQESANASGGEGTGSGGTVAYSVGQVIYTSNTGSTGSVAQGVQHAFEILTVGAKETKLDFSLTAFPNPSTENLSLQISDFNKEKLIYQLFDMQGSLLNSGQISALQTQITTSSLATATYLLNIVNQENKTVQSFKIIKK